MEQCLMNILGSFIGIILAGTAIWCVTTIVDARSIRRSRQAREEYERMEDIARRIEANRRSMPL